jgi:hypothetical protein
MEVTEELVSRLELAAGLLHVTVSDLAERQSFISGEVERISATVETTRREEELMAKLEAMEAELKQLKAEGDRPSPKPLETLRKTLPSATVEMLAKQGIGEGAVDVHALDAALQGLSLEQRIAVKSQLRRAGAVA